MKEKIYTIPVTEAFSVECECPMCVLEKKLEDEYIEYVLGPSLMEPDGRMETNEKGFCRRHFEMSFNKKINSLGLGLILDTYLSVKNEKLREMYEKAASTLSKDAQTTFLKNISNKMSSKQTESEKFIDETIAFLDDIEAKCTVCSKLDYTMDRYADVILYLWVEEEDFRELFNSKKAFCLKHFKLLLQCAKKYLNTKERALFVDNLMKMQLENLGRIQEEVNWFTKKFDYRYQDAPWKNSKDAVQRSIQKIAGYCDLE